MLKKPGPKKKTSKIKNKSVRFHDIKKPDDLKCRRCGIETGTERFAHYEGFRKHEFGKGTGLKCNDNMTAWLCDKCTIFMDAKPDKFILGDYVDPTDDYFYNECVCHSEEWLYLICKTHLLR